ncbi:TlpA family protein disulfide reductase [Psychroserpens sp. Hel_I_66]|uniref:TlpA family protein disulfide reductase n=1 Tax=Psychroserpens sp. Hel_I_66 TaxID=1250004 RepID=UPI000645558F|nr:TlpA disulfide reductase family protein [Psychroserpens sp. Hel_I_66]
MKRLFVAFLAISIIACNEKPKVEYAIVTGKIENSQVKLATIDGADFKAEINIEEDGTFLDTIQITENNFYALTIGREYTPLYLIKGDSLHVDVDATKFDESLKYSGEGAVENNYLAAKMLNESKGIENPVAFYSMEEADFKTKVKTIKNTNNSLLVNLNDADEDFISSEKQNLVYDEYNMLNNYKQRHGYYTKKEDFKISEDFFPAELKDMDFDDSKAYRSSNSYKNIAFDNLLTKLFDTIGDDISNVTVDQLQIIEEAKIPALKNDAIDYLSSFLVTPSNPNMASVYTYLKDNTTKEETKKKLTETFEKNKDLVKGKPSPQFVNYENHKGGELSLADLKGKYVYVDVWATWCGPCIKEIPSLKEVEKKFHNENIEFVSISTDDGRGYKGQTNEEKALLAKEGWKNMIMDKELGGIQLYADNAFNSSFMNDYQVNSIPRFILIDPNGNIVSADAPRPSDPKLVELLERELKM